MILEKEKLVFIHIPRTGGTSVEIALAGKDWWLIDADTKHLSASMTKKILGEERWAEYFKFSIVRNPWDRIISMYATGWWWQNNLRCYKTDTPTLREFIEQLKPHLHERHGLRFYHEIIDLPLNYICRYETLATDFSYVCNIHGLTNIELPHYEKSNRSHYSLYYDDETAKLVGDIYNIDIKLFGYSFERMFGYDKKALSQIKVRE